MTRSKRIQPIKDIADDRERDAGLSVATAQQVLGDSEQQLAKLLAYRADYLRRGADSSFDVVRMQNYQVFMGRLEEAIRQQESLVASARTEVDRRRETWRERHVEAASLGKAVTRMQTEERHTADRHEQKESDERASRQVRPARD